MTACAQGAITGKSDSAGVTFTADGVLVATGHDPFDAEQKPRYSYGQAKNVFTGTEAEDILSRSYYLTKKDESIAFIQCVGSRDPVIGRNYCSGVCCAYAMRMARIVKYRNPEAEVTIYYIDLQNFDKNFTQFKQELVDLGVRFVRGVPFKVEELASGKLKLLIENMGDDEDTIVEHDAVVLSVGLGAAADSPKIAEQFGLSRDEFGFFTTVKDNVFVSGTCKEPLTIPSSIAAAKATALEMGKYKHE
jgi:heterodisulfide reductase subunit A